MSDGVRPLRLACDVNIARVYAHEKQQCKVMYCETDAHCSATRQLSNYICCTRLRSAFLLQRPSRPCVCARACVCPFTFPIRTCAQSLRINGAIVGPADVDAAAGVRVGGAGGGGCGCARWLRDVTPTTDVFVQTSRRPSVSAAPVYRYKFTCPHNAVLVITN